MEFIFVFIIFFVAMSGFILSLQFSKYKQGNSGCCGGGHCESGDSSSGSCYSEKLKFVDDYGNDK